MLDSLVKRLEENTVWPSDVVASQGVRPDLEVTGPLAVL